jgi:hypothetical protein
MDDSLLSGLVAIVFAWLIISLVGVVSINLIPVQATFEYWNLDETQCLTNGFEWVDDGYGGFCDTYDSQTNNMVVQNSFIGLVLLLIAICSIYISKKFIKNKIISVGIFFGGALILIYSTFLLVAILAIDSLITVIFPLMVFLVLIYFILKKDKSKKENIIVKKEIINKKKKKK